ncbi:MAG: hypothetical protein M5U22_18645 [Thermoleophilia bacterium]|nr:hypothetical protein [Thermoleophilia bacterium]
MARLAGQEAECVYRVAEVFRDAALASVDSLLTPGRPIWSAEGLDELHERFVLQPDTSKASFEEKLSRQLTGAGDDAIQLMAEIVLMHLLIHHHISGDKKRQTLQTILGWMAEPTSVSSQVDAALDFGLANPGTYFSTGRDRQLRFLIEWMRSWREVPTDAVPPLLADPWAFREHVLSAEVSGARLQQNAILHLLFPDTFERSVSRNHKQAILAAFADLIGGSDRAQDLDEDRALLEIRQELTKTHGPDVDFYNTPAVERQWRGSGVHPDVPLLSLVQATYPDWTGFADPRFVKDERGYKDAAAALAVSLLGRESLRELIEEGRHDQLVGRIRQVAQATNLLFLAVPRDGDLALLFREELDLSSFAEALFDLLHGDGSGPERLDRFVTYTSSRNLPTKWALPTYLLMLLHPETEFFVKPQATKWFLEQMDAGFDIAFRPTMEAYEGILGLVESLKVDLAEYGPSDLVDIQSYVWVAYSGRTPLALAPPFDRLFPDWDTAQWAFDAMKEAVVRLGIEGPGDPRVAISLTDGGIHLSYGPWLILGFGPEKSVPQAAIIPLREDSKLFPAAFVFEGFTADRTVRDRVVPMSEVRDSWDTAWPEVGEVLDGARHLFGEHAGTPYKLHNHDELEVAVFDAGKRDELLQHGLTLAAAPSVYEHLANSGYHFPQWLVTDYVLSLATKPLVILSGISGTGKTKMAQLVSGFIAPDIEEEFVSTPDAASFGDEFTPVQMPVSALKYRRLTIPVALLEGFVLPPRGAPMDFIVHAEGQQWPARVYAHPNANNVQVHMEPGLFTWFAEHVQTGDYIGMRVLPADGDPEFELEIRTIATERRMERRPSRRIAFLSVRPDWTDNRALLGYYNPLTGNYSSTELLRLLLHAQSNPTESHFVVLDEMNLAKVEHYFSDFLSAMEGETEMVLHDSPEDLYVDLGDVALAVPRRLKVPPNVFFTGTVNVDETTYMFSPKVLDRANTIEFNEVHLASYGVEAPPETGRFRLRDGAGLDSLLDYRKPSPEDWKHLPPAQKARLRALHALLEPHHLHFGYRVANEVARYLNLAAACVAPDSLDAAFDLQVLQKVLPKLAGNRARLEKPLWELLQWCVDPDAGLAAQSAVNLDSIDPYEGAYPRSAAKLKRMIRTLQSVGFVSFVE